MPKTLATALWPSDAAQIVARNRPIDVAVRMIGSAAPTAAAGTTPTRASPSETEPAMKQGSPSAIGTPTGVAEAAASAGDGVGGKSGGRAWRGSTPVARASAINGNAF